MRTGILILVLFFGLNAFAQVSTAMPTPMPAVSTPVAAPSPAATPVPVVTVQAAAPTTPPTWALELLTTVQGLPVIGPLASQAIMYLGIFAAILTSITAALLAILSSLSGVMTFSGLTKAVAWIQGFKNGKIMYWLTYFSNFNAQKPPSA
jgi:hypothetical protein